MKMSKRELLLLEKLVVNYALFLQRTAKERDKLSDYQLELLELRDKLRDLVTESPETPVDPKP